MHVCIGRMLIFLLEREREREMYIYIYIYPGIHIQNISSVRTIDHPAHPAIKANSDDCSRYIANGLLVEESLVGCWLVFSRRRDLAPDAHLASFLEDAVGNAFSIMEEGDS